MITCKILESCCGATTITYANPAIISNTPKPAKIAIIIGILEGIGGKTGSESGSITVRSLQTSQQR